ncbi:MAG: TIGR03618 family F420-dependent PPOX class oxidoreductase [Proteobacteria bacterium]|nr:TIGR03618 family F420-dependent PPOX class oxidoreductase [Pseudomonadota bacterium]
MHLSGSGVVAAEIPSEFMDLLTEKKALAHVAMVTKDGAPNVTPVWFEWVDGRLRFVAQTWTMKAKTLREGSRVAVAIVDPDNPYRYMQLRGIVETIVEGTEAYVDHLSMKYLGTPYPHKKPGQERRIFSIRPDKVQVLA